MQQHDHTLAGCELALPHIRCVAHVDMQARKPQVTAACRARMSACMTAHMPIHMSTHVPKNMYIHIHVSTHLSTHVSIHVSRINTCPYTCSLSYRAWATLCTRMPICMPIHKSILMYKHVLTNGAYTPAACRIGCARLCAHTCPVPICTDPPNCARPAAQNAPVSIATTDIRMDMLGIGIVVADLPQVPSQTATHSQSLNAGTSAYGHACKHL